MLQHGLASVSSSRIPTRMTKNSIPSSKPTISNKPAFTIYRSKNACKKISKLVEQCIRLVHMSPMRTRRPETYGVTVQVIIKIIDTFCLHSPLHTGGLTSKCRRFSWKIDFFKEHLVFWAYGNRYIWGKQTRWKIII